ncbi:hypothetical protein MGYG_08597 [Nannizzia gypsea CBS 118893]|uniref:CHAT domain-containing protein n=1 Tax=Arthroderma gypseum (strain ATCC MYA-4604 / CBS 118893) TaxID=535722 RepID=E4V6F8_ARTGP|nr:hypothetical protein MGYG_08597 [Nannizzia gypsea CBS 118893]EFQ96674.1 hypothetical protein MGYG_08597 [Nannizzia gypsea CBS 118893]
MDNDQEARPLGQEASATSSEDSPHRRDHCDDTGVRLGNRYLLSTGTEPDLDESIARMREAIDPLSPDNQTQARYKSILGKLLIEKFYLTGEAFPLNDSISLGREVINITPLGHPNRAEYLNTLAITLNLRFSKSNATADLEGAIQLGRETITITSPGATNREKYLNDLGTWLHDRYVRTGVVSDLEEAIRLEREAVTTTPNELDTAKYLNILGNLLIAKYDRAGDGADLEEALAIGQKVVKLTPKGHPNWPERLSNLASTLRHKYLRTKTLPNLERAFRMGKLAVAIMPEGYQEQATCLSVLGNVLYDKYLRTGAISDLEEAIRIGQKALDLTTKHHRDRESYLSNLAIMFDVKYLRIGMISDLDVAIQLGREAVDTSPETHICYPGRLNNLGNRYREKYLRLALMSELEEAIRLIQMAVDLTEDCPDYAMYLSNLSATFGDKYLRTREDCDIENAIQFGRKALDISPASSIDCARRLNNLGILFGYRYEKRGAISDLEEAIRLGRDAINKMPEELPERAGVLNDLGMRLGRKYIKTEDRVHLQDALSCHQLALRQLTASIMTRITAGREILHHCALILDWDGAYEAAEVALRLIPTLTTRSLTNADKQYILSQVVGLASDAAAASLNAGNGPFVTLGLLEQGRDVLASSLEEIRIDVLELQQRYPELAQRFLQLQNELDLPDPGSFPFQADSGETLMQKASRRYEAGKEFDSLICEIREQPGFKEFLLPPTDTEILATAKHGPIVVINVSQYRCDAILIEHHQIRSLGLPHLRSKDVIKRAEAANLATFEHLVWLWDNVMDPILNALGFTEPPSDANWPRVWWIPTGTLSKFPVHAAGRHIEGSSSTVLDRVMSSYSLSVKGMISGRRRQLDILAPFQALLVAMDHTPGSSRLPFAMKEVEALRGILAEMAINTIEPGRTKESITSYLQQCKIFHFAGHGYTDRINPSRSYLLLDDGKENPLTVASLLEMNLREHSPFLAYLSACGTGRIKNEKFTDQGIHLISAFQLAGFRHVIGTLWEVNDAVCVDIARIVYEALRDGVRAITDKTVCQGLHNASRVLRDRCLTMPITATITRAVGEPSLDADLRDIVLCDDDDDDDNNGQTLTLPWVAYVHYGV